MDPNKYETISSEVLPSRRAMPDPVLSDAPPIKEVTLTWFLCVQIE